MRSPGLYVELESWNYRSAPCLRASKNWDRSTQDSR